MSATCTRIRPILLSVLRIVAAYLFLLYGTTKLSGFLIAMDGGSPEGLVLVAGILEIVGGILPVLGLFTRSAIFTLSSQMAVAYFMVYAAKGPALLSPANGGESIVLFCFVLLYLATAGSSSLVLGNLFGKNKA